MLQETEKGRDRLETFIRWQESKRNHLDLLHHVYKPAFSHIEERPKQILTKAIKSVFVFDDYPNAVFLSQGRSGAGKTGECTIARNSLRDFYTYEHIRWEFEEESVYKTILKKRNKTLKNAQQDFDEMISDTQSSWGFPNVDKEFINKLESLVRDGVKPDEEEFLMAVFGRVIRRAREILSKPGKRIVIIDALDGTRFDVSQQNFFTRPWASQLSEMIHLEFPNTLIATNALAPGPTLEDYVKARTKHQEEESANENERLGASGSGAMVEVGEKMAKAAAQAFKKFHPEEIPEEALELETALKNTPLENITSVPFKIKNEEYAALVDLAIQKALRKYNNLAKGRKAAFDFLYESLDLASIHLNHNKYATPGFTGAYFTTPQLMELI